MLLEICKMYAWILSDIYNVATVIATVSVGNACRDQTPCCLRVLTGNCRSRVTLGHRCVDDTLRAYRDVHIPQHTSVSIHYRSFLHYFTALWILLV